MVVQDVAIIYSKKLRNRVAGYVTRLYKRVQNGTANKVYIKLHEEERERKEAFIPKNSVVDIERVDVDSVTYEMIKQYGFRGNYKLIDSSMQI